jgi:hypothetical protein
MALEIQSSKVPDAWHHAVWYRALAVRRGSPTPPKRATEGLGTEKEAPYAFKAEAMGTRFQSRLRNQDTGERCVISFCEPSSYC